MSADKDRPQNQGQPDRDLPHGISDQAPAYTPQERADRDNTRDEGGDPAKARPDRTPQGRTDNA